MASGISKTVVVDLAAKFEVAAKDKIDNRDVYVVNATRTDQKRERLYFDSDNGLLLRRVADTSTIIGVYSRGNGLR